ncbi:hypothetical protein [uncultured Selenomonas sp.]|uniref:hypothetical protein n=1 Tax=uncultured Selenomonas sp. TaxID=159275 RepID=UPI0028E4F900|nr:hypothetical protein [uncultured Selenomonas sp.]
MFDALNSFFRWILMTLFLIFCLVFALVTGVSDVLKTVLSEPLLLAFVLLGSVGVVLAVHQYSKYQKAYFERHPERKI